MAQIAERLVDALEGLLGTRLPFRVQTWDGGVAGAPDGPLLVLRNRRALRQLLWAPGELGMARAYVSGDLEVGTGPDLYRLLAEVAHSVERPEQKGRHLGLADLAGRHGRAADKALLRAGAIGPRPPVPPEEARPAGRLHSRGRDRAAISHHYDVGNDFYRLVLGPSMVYSCAFWTPEARVSRTPSSPSST